MTAQSLVRRHPALRHTGISRMNLPALLKGSEILDALKAHNGKTLNHVWGYDPDTKNSEHHSGRALDFMVHSDRKSGDFIADYVIKNAERFGLIHMIWRQRIYRGPMSTSKNPKGKWEKMADRGSPTQNHMDHPHVFLSPTKYVAPSLPVKEKTPELTARMFRGSSGNQVRLLQIMLNTLRGSKLDTDGKFGPLTERAVISAHKAWKVAAPYNVVGPGFRAAINSRYKEKVTAIARDVINGKFKNYPERKRLLEAKNYDYQTIQNRVRELLG